MNFFTQGFLFSRTEFRIKKKNKKNGFKVTVFFLRGHGRWSLIHSYQKTVFPRSGKKKKNVFFFISRGKVHRSFNQILIKFLFLYKSLFCFFTAFLCVVFFFFFFTEKFKGHSFIRFLGRKKKEKKAFYPGGGTYMQFIRGEESC